MTTTHFIVHPDFVIQSKDVDSIVEYTKKITNLVKNEKSVYAVIGNFPPSPKNEFENSDDYRR